MVKLPKMKDPVKYISLTVAIGALVGLLTFRLAAEGKLPVKINSTTLQTINNQTRTIVQEENAIISVVEATSPSVVAIGVTQRVSNPFDPFSIPRSRQSTIGTGFVVSDKGVVVTNKHVVDDPAAQFSVVSKEGKKYEIERIYRDPNFDLALVKIKGSDLKSLEMGDSAKIKVGQTVIAIGNALGRFDNTVTTGVVSGVGRDITIPDFFTGTRETLDNLIQTDAAINPGNSGGPLLNSAGQVIGVNVATTEGAQNIGFAIPIESVKPIIDEFVNTGAVTRAYMGIRYRVIAKDVAILNEVPQGAYIQEIVAGSPAEKSGIKVGDIITKIDGRGVSSDNTIADSIRSKKPGQNVSVEIWSEGNSTRTINVTLEQAPGG